MKPKVVSLFSGCGGMDIGFKTAGYQIIFSTDNWPIAIETLKNNTQGKQEILCSDIGEVNFKRIKKRHGEIEVLIGGPPCPPFSKSRFYRESLPRGMKDEVANHTMSNYFRAVKELKPKTFVFENVPGFVYKPHKEAKEFLDKKTKELGYELIFENVINCADYGVPQIRQRFIAIGKRRNIKNSYRFPNKTHIDPSKHNQIEFQNDYLQDEVDFWVNCKKAIGEFNYKNKADLPAGSKHMDLLKQIPPGQNYLFFTKERGNKHPKFKWRSRYWSFLLKLDPEKPSWTIQASFSNNQGPFHWTNRFLRIEEIKRLQAFPDEYEIEGSFRDQWRQIGNAVPPLFAEIIAQSIKKQLFN